MQMIIRASMRTDIPAFYLPWFMKRLHAGYVLVKNPYNERQISRVSLHKDVVDAIIFCKKNPTLLVTELSTMLEMGYTIGCMVSITPYQKDIEPNVYDKEKIITAFKAVSKQLGKKNIVWRYDPILLNDTYTIDYHIQSFNKLCSQLSEYTNTVIISFIDIYAHLKKIFRAMSEEEIHKLAKAFGAIAKSYHMKIQTCAENYDLKTYGIIQGACIDTLWIKEMIGASLTIPKSNTRQHCQCVQTIDIGSYDSCLHGCTYFVMPTIMKKKSFKIINTMI